MSVDTTDKRRSARPLALIILAVVFAGLILYSAVFIRITAGKPPKTEFIVTELSLSHKIERDKDGKLRVPAEEPDADKEGGSKSDGDACST